MGLKVGEMFVNLGVKGGEQSLNLLAGTKNAVMGVKNASLEMKAAIVAAFYMIGKLVSSSGEVGTGLKNFNALTGVGTKQLQQYNYAARQVLGTNVDMAQTFQSLQMAMSDMLAGKGAPQAMALMIQSLKNAGEQLNESEVFSYRDNPLLLFQRLQQFANLEKNPATRAWVLKSFGLNDQVIAAMARNAFRPDVMKRAPTYSDKEIDNLNRAKVAWSDLGLKIEMAVGRFNALHGRELVKDIEKITMAVLKLTEKLVLLAEKAKVFDILGAGIETITNPGAVIDKNRGAIDKSAFRDLLPSNMAKDLKLLFGGGRTVTPPPNLTVNQTIWLQNRGASEQEIQRISDLVAQGNKKAIREAYDQITARSGGN